LVIGAGEAEVVAGVVVVCCALPAMGAARARTRAEQRVILGKFNMGEVPFFLPCFDADQRNSDVC
jgi:hypothetical protein